MRDIAVGGMPPGVHAPPTSPPPASRVRDAEVAEEAPAAANAPVGCGLECSRDDEALPAATGAHTTLSRWVPHAIQTPSSYPVPTTWIRDIEAATTTAAHLIGPLDEFEDVSRDNASKLSDTTVARWEALVTGIRMETKINRAYMRVHGEYRIHEAKKLMLIYMLMILMALASAWFKQLPIIESVIRGVTSTVNAFLYMCITLAANERFLAFADDIFASFIAFNVVVLSYLTYETAWGTIPFVIVSMFISELPAHHNTQIILAHAIATPAFEIVLVGSERFTIAYLLEVMLLLLIIMTSDLVVAACVYDRNASHKAIFKSMFIQLSERTNAFVEDNRFVYYAACTGLYETYRRRWVHLACEHLLACTASIGRPPCDSRLLTAPCCAARSFACFPCRATGFKPRLTPSSQRNFDIQSVIDFVHQTNIVPMLPDALEQRFEVLAEWSGVQRSSSLGPALTSPSHQSRLNTSSIPSIGFSSPQVAPQQMTTPRELRGSVPFEWIMAQTPSAPTPNASTNSHRVFRKRTARRSTEGPGMPQHAEQERQSFWEVLPLKDESELKWMPKEDYILTKYRENYTAQMNLVSLFQLHNQTFSIWTHLFPAFVMPVAYCVVHAQALGSTPFEFRVISTVATTLTTVQLFVSAAAHTFYNNSIQSYRFWWKLDFAFICVGMYSYCFRFGYAALLCDGAHRRAEFYLICAAVCVTSLMVTLFHAKELYRLLGMVFVFAVCNVVPQLTMVFQGNIGLRAPVFRSAIGSYSSFGVALIFYIAKFPERVGNGRFDVYMSSHQIWHIGIAGAHMFDALYMPYIVASLPIDTICAATA